MAEVDSKLASEFIASPSHQKGRKYPITRVTIHHTATVTKARVTANGFALPSRRASATYCIGNDGSIVQCVKESDMPWTSSSYDNDNRAITIEVSNSAKYGNWPVGEKAMEALIRLLVDICQRNPGIGRLRYTGDLSGNLTMHKWFEKTECPGPYLGGKFPEIAAEVNKRLDAANVPKVTTVYDLTASGLPEALAEQVVAELKAAGYSATLTAREVKQEQTGYHSIAGKAVATAAQMVAYIKTKRPSVEQSVIDMIPLYISEGQTEGIAGDIAFAQSCVETGNFAFPAETCAVTLNQNNFAMMGVTSTFAKGESFATPQIGIRAQIQHLKAYANSDPLGGECVDPRFHLCDLGYTQAQLINGVQVGQMQQGYETRIAVNGVGQKLSDCCCDIKQEIAGVNNGLGRAIERGFCDTNYNMQAQHNATMIAIDKVGDRVIDYLNSTRMQDLQAENQALRMAASQQAQNNTIKGYVAEQFAYYNPRPVPAYQVQNPNCCNGVNGCGSF